MEVIIVDAAGRIVLRREVGSDGRIRVGELPNGNYWLTGGNNTLPFTKQ
jgi:hypothetical protein